MNVKSSEDVVGTKGDAHGENPTMMPLRKQTVEHPFGTMKSWVGMSHFKTKTLKRVSTEIILHVLAYNLTRMINMMGIKPLITAIEA